MAAMRKIIILSLLFITGLQVLGQDEVFDAVARAIEKSDARQLSAYFNTTVEIGLSGKENTYSASQGEMVMKDFFRRAPAKAFTIVQKGTTGNRGHFAIGDYHTDSAKYQVYIRLQMSGERYLIHQVKFEEKN